VLRVALVLGFPPHSSAFWCDVRRFFADVPLHRLEDGVLHPSGSVPFGLFSRQEVQIICRLGGQAHCNDGFSISHGKPTLYLNNKYSCSNVDRGGESIGPVWAGPIIRKI